MANVDWRSEEAYANFKNAESVDVAWEWLRRDAEYRRDYQSLDKPQRLSGATENFRLQWGLSFRS
jgi:transcriptional regulator